MLCFLEAINFMQNPGDEEQCHLYYNAQILIY
jgi:hypothetical protein